MTEREHQPAQSPRTRRRRSSLISDPFDTPSDWNVPVSPYAARPPPSSFPAFPFQHHAGNPDPGTPIPGFSSRRSSFDSTSADHRTPSIESHLLNAPPKAQSEHGHSSSATSNGNSLHRGSAGFQAMSPSMSHLPSTNSRNHSFRAPFLSPSSRPTSSLWSPPSVHDLHSQIQAPSVTSPSGSTTALPSTKAPLPSTRLSQPLTKSDKPWLAERRSVLSPGRDRLSYFVTFLCIMLGLGGAGCLVYFDTRPNSIHRLAESDLCLILEDQFTGSDIDTSVWKRDVGLGGFGNGEFQVMTSSSDNAKIVNDQLYIIPTLTSARIGSDSIFDGYKYNADGCTTPQNKSACAVTSSANTSTVIPPVESARLTTNGTKTIRYGRVEVRAKLPQGDWFWPAIWMLPQDSNYGQWPLSGEIDIMESRGNSAEYPFEGVNYARSSLNYGPLPGVLAQLTSSVPIKRAKAGFAEDFHTYTLEWSPNFMRMYIDKRLHATMDLSITNTKESFWNRGNFPATAPSGTSDSQVVVENVWGKYGGGYNAPYDQEFYLIISLAVGGTSGWFPDNLGGKPWADGSRDAMVDFAKAQDEWSKTWPENLDDRAFRIDYVKMWKLGGC